MTRRLTAILALALLVAAPVQGAVTDAQAFATAQGEQAAQNAAFDEAWALYTSAVSAAEKATALNDLETLLAHTVTLVASLDVRPCFDAWHRVITDFWDILVAAIAALRAGTALSPEEVAHGTALNAIIHDPAFAGYFDCGGVA